MQPEAAAFPPRSAEPAKGSPEDRTNSGERWPDEAAESAFLGEAHGQGIVLPPPPGPVTSDEAEPATLPAVDELAARVPAEVRELLDELFRARFTTVRRVPIKALKS